MIPIFSEEEKTEEKKSITPDTTVYWKKYIVCRTVLFIHRLSYDLFRLPTNGVNLKYTSVISPIKHNQAAQVSLSIEWENPISTSVSVSLNLQLLLLWNPRLSFWRCLKYIASVLGKANINKVKLSFHQLILNTLTRCSSCSLITSGT